MHLLLLGELVVRNKFWKTLDPEYFYEKIEEATEFLKEKGCDTTAIDVLLLDPEAEDEADDQNDRRRKKRQCRLRGSH